MVIKLAVFDYDGVFTNNLVKFDNNNIKKFYNIKDGKGLSMLKNYNIKIALLSNFNTKLEIKYNDLDEENFKSHLNFDYFYIGSEKKINILNKWMKQLNICFNDISYIGDDINDLEILEKCKLSSCPNDAIDQCKNIVKYICKKKGGDGCIREFSEFIINYNNGYIHDKISEFNTIKNDIKYDFEYQINNIDFKSINNLANIIKYTNNNIYFIGIGKSGNIAKHCSELLKCISIKSFTFNILNLLHGDLGIIQKNDIVIFFSNSGETKELIDIIPSLKIKQAYLIGVFCKKSKFKDLFDEIILIPFTKEISGNINKIPTNSIMSQLLFSNILVSLLKTKINLEEYQYNHKFGKIGESFKKVKELLIYKYPTIILNDKIDITNILYTMNNYKLGCCFFLDNKKKLIGLLTDKDIRELFHKLNKMKCLY